MKRNMKTPEEIKEALEICDNNSECKDLCPYWRGMPSMVNCRERLTRDTKAYIEQLEKARDELAEQLDMARVDLEQIKRGLEALLEDLRAADYYECSHCRHYIHDMSKCTPCDCNCAECTEACVCKECKENDRWEWRGPQEVAPDE